MRVKYIGPIDSVDIPALGVVAVRGVPVDIDDASAEILLAQIDNWAVASAPAESKKG